MRSYLYDSSGRWIGFRTDPEGRYLFDPSGDWIGWFPWADNDDALSPDGRYLGTVVENRLLRRTSPGYREDPGYPGAPAFPGRAPYPGAAAYAGCTPGFEDVPAERLAPDQARSASVGVFADF